MGKATPMTKKRTKRITLKELYAEPFKPVEGAGGEAAVILEHQLGKPIARSERGQYAARDLNNLIERKLEGRTADGGGSILAKLGRIEELIGELKQTLGGL